MIKELSNIELNQYITFSRDCRVADTCVLQGNSGKVSYKFTECHEIDLVIKRNSGDGKILIETIHGIQSYVIHSKISQTIQIGMVNEFTVSRAPGSIGEISILGLVMNLKNGSEDMVSYWKSLIARCGRHRNLKLVGYKLFANHGAFIEKASNISLIETSPPSMFVREGDVIKFLGSCEITNLVLVPEAMPEDMPTPFPHRVTGGPEIYKEPEIKSFTMNKNVIYNSQACNEFNPTKSGQSNIVKFIKSNNENFLLLRRTGEYQIPISSATYNNTYLISITSKRLNGTGKLYVGFKDEQNRIVSKVEFSAGNQITERFVKVTTENPANFYKLYLHMDETFIGEILISKIEVAQEIPTPKPIDTVIFPPQFNTTRPVANKLNKKFVIVVPSYNNSQWYEKNLSSIICQDYDNFRAIYIDDNSPDSTGNLVEQYLKTYDKNGIVSLIKNDTRKGALENLYNAIHSCDDDEIIVTLDGDDWLAHAQVLQRLNNVYRGDVWMTYGQYQNYPDGQIGLCQQIPDHIIAENNFRSYMWCSSHLRTFYSWLFKRIKKEDLFYQGNFMSMTWDMAMCFPALEMSGQRSKFINEVLYIYNLENPINDHKVNKELQQNLDRYVRALPKYSPVPCLPKFKKNVGLLLIGTGKYHQFIQPLIKSADNLFLKNHNVTYYVFSDRTNELTSSRKIVQLPIEHRQFPFASMDRFKHFANNNKELIKQDYLYYIDVDCLFVSEINEEIFGNLVGVQHCGFVNLRGPVEDNPASVMYVPPDRYRHYFGGGFSGGKSENYLQLAKMCYEMIEKDVANGIIPRFHDETAINRYFLDNEPDVVLNPSYHYPQSNLSHYQGIWNRNYEPKILLLDKNHDEIRS